MATPSIHDSILFKRNICIKREKKTKEFFHFLILFEWLQLSPINKEKKKVDVSKRITLFFS